MCEYRESITDILEEINDDISNELLSTECGECEEIDISDSIDHISFKYKYNRTRTRTRIRLGRFINKILPDKYSARDIELFVNRYKSILGFKAANFSIEKGMKILDAYSRDKYNENTGSLSNSCMTDESEEVLKLYTSNENKIKILVLNDGYGKIYGRALIWNNVFFRPGETIEDRLISETYKVTIMDRIYTTKDYYNDMFRKYCKNMGWYYRDNGSLSFINPNDPSDCIIKGRVKINLKNFEDLNILPSIDTMYSLSKSGTLSNKRWNTDNISNISMW